jgi:CheY-like chemotaxis protein
MNTHSAYSGHKAGEHPAVAGVSHRYQQGGTLLLVEDSRLFSDAIRMMFRGTGGRMRRADTLRRARRHLALYTPDAVIIDLGLPDGSGLELITECARRPLRVPRIIAISGQPEREAAAYAAGADRFMAKPIASLAQFRAALAPSCFATAPHEQILPEAMPDMGAMRDDFYLALDLLQGPDAGARRAYALQFIEGLARSLHDTAMLDALGAVQNGAATGPLVGVLRQRLRAQPLI